MPIEDDFDVPFIAAHARREKQIQQNYRPIIAVHKWFARRPGTLFRGLLLAEFCKGPLRDEFYRPHDFEGLRVADPFMGGGIPLLEANRLGCDVNGFDINPMSYWIVREEIEHIDLTAYKSEADRLVGRLREQVGEAYRTRCAYCNASAVVKYFLWVKRRQCVQCRESFDLFPGYLLSENRRHPNYVVVCRACGELTEAISPSELPNCSACRTPLILDGPARKGSCTCPRCGYRQSYPGSIVAPLDHRLFAIEYYCEDCKADHRGRFFKRPDDDDLEKYETAAARLKRIRARFIPDAAIEPGDETNRLLRWGYRKFRDMFNDRQLFGLEVSARLINEIRDARIRRALVTNLSDLLRYQNMLCRYDTAVLKSLDIFSVHGFPVGLVQCESNLLGIRSSAGTNIGSGGWDNIITKYVKAKSFCDEPFEVSATARRAIPVPTPGEWIGEHRDGRRPRKVRIECADSTSVVLDEGTLDAVITDPPYFGNVQYAELMEFCYVWLKRLAGDADPALLSHTVRDPEELTGNVTFDRGIEHFTNGLSGVFRRMAVALKPTAPLVFTYHHNDLSAYRPLVVAILDAGLVCTRVIPCPAEMGGSIHINGTQSSTIDSVFVCRRPGVVPVKEPPRTPKQLAATVNDDLVQLAKGGVEASEGDIHCITCGHLAQVAIAKLRSTWDSSLPVSRRLCEAASAFTTGIDLATVKRELASAQPKRHVRPMPLFDSPEERLEGAAK
jgi:putative DNA methylase